MLQYQVHLLCLGVVFRDFIPNSSCSMHQSNCLFSCSSALWGKKFRHQNSSLTETPQCIFGAKHRTLTSSVSLPASLTWTEPDSCRGSEICFFPDFFFFFLDFVCNTTWSIELTSWDICTWAPSWLSWDEMFWVSVVSICSTVGILKLNKKLEPCPFMESQPLAGSASSEGADVGFTGAGQSTGMKSNLKLLSLLAQTELLMWVELFDLVSISVMSKQKNIRKKHLAYTYLYYIKFLF